MMTPFVHQSCPTSTIDACSGLVQVEDVEGRGRGKELRKKEEVLKTGKIIVILVHTGSWSLFPKYVRSPRHSQGMAV